MGTYATIHFVCVLILVSLTFRISDKFYWPASAMLLSLAGARFAEWGPFDPITVMVFVCLVCMFVAVRGKGVIAKAICTLYFLRMCIFVYLEHRVTIENSWIVWELSNALVILQVLLLSAGATDDWLGNPTSLRTRSGPMRRFGHLLNVAQRR